MSSGPFHKDPINFPRIDRLLFFAGILVLAAALPIGLRYCRQGVTELAVAAGAEDRTLVFTQWWEDEMEAGSLAALVRDFETQNPGIRIQLDTRPYAEVHRLLFAGDSGAEAESADAEGGAEGVEAAEVQAAFMPDILGLDPRWLEDLIRQGKLASHEGETAAQGAAYALPLVSFMTPLFYRIDLLQAAGFDRPPKSQGEFSAMVRTLTDKNADRYGFALSLSPEDPQGIYRDILPWFRSSGAGLFRRGSLEFSGPQVIGVLGFLNGLYREGLIAPEVFTMTNKDRIEDFSAGRVAMMIASIGEARTLQAAGVPLGITTIPGPDGYIGKPSVGITSWYAGLSRSSRHGDEGRAFLAFLAEQSPAIAKSAGAVPGAIAPVSTDPEESIDASKNSFETSSLYAKAYDIYEAGDIPEEFPGLPEQNALESILREELRVMFEKGRSPEETAKAVQTRWETSIR